MQIEKKSSKKHFGKILSGEKKFDIRLNDWQCQVGDTLLLKEWDGVVKKYTGRELTKEISYIAKTKDLDLFPTEEIQKYGYQILSLRDNKSRTGIDNIGVAVSFFCHDGQGNILLHKRSQGCRDEKGTWTDGGGKLEFSESFQEGALRELREEYGCDGEIAYNLKPESVIRDNNGIKTHWIMIPFIIKINRKLAKIGDPKSMVELGWFKLDNLPNPMHSAVSKRINSNIDILNRYIN